MVDILKVQFHPASEVERATTLECPQASQTGFHSEPTPLPRLIFFHLLRERWPRPDERHIALQDVKELRQLVEAEFAHHPADRRTTRVVFHLEDGSIHFVKGAKLG